jgi:hypothetical protein
MEILGDADLLDRPWGFAGPFRRMTFASRMQHRIYWGRLRKPLEWSLRTFLAPWAYIASVAYHDLFWYPTHLGTVRRVMSSDWGRLFQNWEALALPADDLRTPGWPDPGPAPGKWKRGLLPLLWTGLRILVLAVREAPEFRRRREGPRP